MGRAHSREAKLVGVHTPAKKKIKGCQNTECKHNVYAKAEEIIDMAKVKTRTVRPLTRPITALLVVDVVTAATAVSELLDVVDVDVAGTGVVVGSNGDASGVI